MTAWLWNCVPLHPTSPAPHQSPNCPSKSPLIQKAAPIQKPTQPKSTQARRTCEVPEYDFTTHSRSAQTRRVAPADVVLIEGILVLHIAAVRELLNMKIYVDTDDDVRLARRIQRDVAMRGRDVAGVISQYTKFVKPAFDAFVAPSRKHADVIIPWARGDNVVAIDLITEHIRMKLQQHDLRRIYTNLEIIPSNYQVRACVRACVAVTLRWGRPGGGRGRTVSAPRCTTGGCGSKAAPHLHNATP